jgi:hypothetical protein
MCRITQNLARARVEGLLNIGKIILTPLILHSHTYLTLLYTNRLKLDTE